MQKNYAVREKASTEYYSAFCPNLISADHTHFKIVHVLFVKSAPKNVLAKTLL
jgi:hypothetical protein